MDNALDVVQLGGIELLVSTISDSVPIYALAGHSFSPLEASTATRLEMGSVALQALGAACASNPGVQIPALEAGALDPLLALLNASHPSDPSDADFDAHSVTSEASTSATDPNPNSNPNSNPGLNANSNSTSASEQRELRHQVANGALFALGALLRQFPYAQRRFVELGGLRTLIDLLHRTRLLWSARHEPALRRTMFRTLTLAHDLLAERELHYTTMNTSNEEHREKLRQYDWYEYTVQFMIFYESPVSLLPSKIFYSKILLTFSIFMYSTINMN